MQSFGHILPNTTSGPDWLGRYYTNDAISSLLVSLMAPDRPGTVLDLGSGDGALTAAAARRWQDSQLITVDIDQNAPSTRLSFADSETGAKHFHIRADALNIDLPQQIGMPLGSVDVAVCNPPYIRLPWRKCYAELLEEVGLSKVCPAIKEVSADVVFIAQNLRLLRAGGQMGLIVPDGLISGEKAAEVRKVLINQHQIDGVIKLPRRVFVGTEAQAHILLISKLGENNGLIKLMEFRATGGLSEPIVIPAEQGIRRLDYGYFHYQKSFHSSKKVNTGKTLKQLDVTLARGTLNSCQAKLVDFPVFHTSDFPDRQHKHMLNLPKKPTIPEIVAKTSDLVTAKRGDILLARVGRGLENKVCIVDRGNAAITDCVFRLRVPIKLRTQVLNALTSASGRDYLRAVSHGVGAKHLSMKDLLEFSINDK